MLISNEFFFHLEEKFMMEYLRRMKTTAVVDHNRRLSILTILLASISFLLVITSITAFIYVTRKGTIDLDI